MSKQEIIIYRLSQYPTDTLKSCDFPISTIKALEKKGFLTIVSDNRLRCGEVMVKKC